MRSLSISRRNNRMTALKSLLRLPAAVCTSSPRAAPKALTRLLRVSSVNNLARRQIAAAADNMADSMLTAIPSMNTKVRAPLPTLVHLYLRPLFWADPLPYLRKVAPIDVSSHIICVATLDRPAYTFPPRHAARMLTPLATSATLSRHFLLKSAQ